MNQSGFVLALILIIQTVVAAAAPYEPSPEDYKMRKMMENLRHDVGAWHMLGKRAPHNIEARALNQFKNCYFSPIQCVLMERRRR